MLSRENRLRCLSDLDARGWAGSRRSGDTVTIYKSCTVCGRRYQPTSPRDRRCPEHQPTRTYKPGRVNRSPTTRAQDNTYRKNRLLVLERDQGKPCPLCGTARATHRDRPHRLCCSRVAAMTSATCKPPTHTATEASRQGNPLPNRSDRLTCPQARRQHPNRGRWSHEHQGGGKPSRSVRGRVRSQSRAATESFLCVRADNPWAMTQGSQTVAVASGAL